MSPLQKSELHGQLTLADGASTLAGDAGAGDKWYPQQWCFCAIVHKITQQAACMLLWQVLQVPLWKHAEQRLSHQQMPSSSSKVFNSVPEGCDA